MLVLDVPIDGRPLEAAVGEFGMALEQVAHLSAPDR